MADKGIGPIDYLSSSELTVELNVFTQIINNSISQSSLLLVKICEISDVGKYEEVESIQTTLVAIISELTKASRCIHILDRELNDYVRREYEYHEITRSFKTLIIQQRQVIDDLKIKPESVSCETNTDEALACSECETMTAQLQVYQEIIEKYQHEKREASAQNMV